MSNTQIYIKECIQLEVYTNDCQLIDGKEIIFQSDLINNQQLGEGYLMYFETENNNLHISLYNNAKNKIKIFKKYLLSGFFYSIDELIKEEILERYQKGASYSKSDWDEFRVNEILEKEKDHFKGVLNLKPRVVKNIELVQGVPYKVRIERSEIREKRIPEEFFSKPKLWKLIEDTCSRETSLAAIKKVIYDENIISPFEQLLIGSIPVPIERLRQREFREKVERESINFLKIQKYKITKKVPEIPKRKEVLVDKAFLFKETEDKPKLEKGILHLSIFRKIANTFQMKQKTLGYLMFFICIICVVSALIYFFPYKEEYLRIESASNEKIFSEQVIAFKAFGKNVKNVRWHLEDTVYKGLSIEHIFSKSINKNQKIYVFGTGKYTESNLEDSLAVEVFGTSIEIGALELEDLIYDFLQLCNQNRSTIEQEETIKSKFSFSDVEVKQYQNENDAINEKFGYSINLDKWLNSICLRGGNNRIKILKISKLSENYIIYSYK